MSRRLLINVLIVIYSGCGVSQVCHVDQIAQPRRAQPHPLVGYHMRAHSHNDYEHMNPLADALAQKFYSVEADIYLTGGQLSVSHHPWGAKGTLEQLYLDPLQALVRARGSVHGDELPFTLWIDLKESSHELVSTLHAALERYPMLTRVSGTELMEGPVTVVLTGNAAAKERFVSLYNPRNAVRDSNDYSPDDTPADTAWRYYALKWSDYIQSSNTNALDSTQRARLACIVHNAHEKGRKLRFFGAPDSLELWRISLEYDIDFINTDKLTQLHDFLSAQP